MDKNKRALKTQKSKGQRDEESRPLLAYEGGDAAPEEKPEDKPDDKPEEKKEDEPEKKEEEEKKEEMMEEPEELEEVSTTHLCCKYSTAMLVYGVFLWILGIMCLANCLIIFGNMYMPWWYPTIMTVIMLFYLAGLVLIAIWFCNESQSARTGAIIAGWLILGAIVALILFNVFFVLNHNKHKKEGIKVGSGDDPDDYDDEDRQAYILGYLIWGSVIIVLDVLFIYCAMSHADLFPDELDEMMMGDDMMMEGKDMEGGNIEWTREEREIRKKHTEKYKRFLARYSRQPYKPPRRQTRRSVQSKNSSQRSISVSSKSSSQRSVKSVRSVKSGAKPNAKPVIRNSKQAAFKEIDNNQTPRGSFREQLSYENGKFSQSIQFDNEQSVKQTKSLKGN